MLMLTKKLRKKIKKRDRHKATPGLPLAWKESAGAPDPG